MAEEKATNIGRFRYIEPTNMNLDLPDNAITFPYEDYDIGVKLEVTIPDRFSCGRPDGNTIMFSSNNGSLEFFGGTGAVMKDSANDKKARQGYLTTSFTDISSNNVDRGNRECLGIESINISYQQWFYPIVNIKFVDIRGASLFMPQEKALQATVNSGDKNITQVDSGSFFKAIFACPSPIFKLTVMGFYGKSVTFNLKMSSFQSEFDSENGNFIANVDFVGNMYGVYTEIPLQYLAIAPYLNMNYWEANKGSKFAFNEGKEMLTFPEFWKEVKEMEKSAEKIVEQWKSENEYNLVLTRERELGNIKSTFDYTFKGWNSYTLNNEIFYYYVSDKEFGNDCIKPAMIKGLYEKIKDYNKEYNESLPFSEFEPPINVNANDEELKIHYVEKYGKYYALNNAIRNYDDKSETGNVLALNNIEQKEYNLKSQAIGNKQYVFEFSSNLLNYINESLNNTKKIKEEKDKQLEEYKYNKSTDLLGFNLSIGNIFKMIFAHLDCFINEYYNTLSNIEDGKSNRELSKLGLNFDTTDVPSNITSLPPYPLTYGKSSDDTDKTEVKWPADIINNGTVLDETILVEKILGASHNYLSAMTAAENEINVFTGDKSKKDLNPSTNAMIPLTIYDFMKSDGTINPYNNAVDNNYYDSIEKIKTIFTLRCLYAIYIYGGTSFWNSNRSKLETNDEDYVAWTEALNIRKAFGPTMDDDIIQMLGFNDESAINKSVEEFIKYLTEDNNSPYWSTIGTKLIEKEDKNNNSRYCLIKNEDDLILPLKYDVSEIKNDIINNNINSEYLHLVIQSANSETFVVKSDNKNEDFFYDLKNNICLNADNYKLPVKKAEVDRFFSKFGSGNNSSIFNNGFITYRLEKDSNKYKYKFVNKEEDDFEKCVAIRTTINTYPNENTLFNLVTYGSGKNNAGGYGERQGVFQTDFYKCQQNNYAQAYCFVFSNCVNSDNVSLRKINSGKIPYFILLQEGAYYWRKQNPGDISFTLNGKTINKKMTENIDTIPVDYSLNFVSTTNEEQTFVTWDNIGGKTDSSETRKERLIQLFKDFATSKDFNTLKQYLETNSLNIDKTDNKVFDMQKLFLEMINKYAFILDYSTRADNREIKINFDIDSLKNTYRKLLNNLKNIYLEDYNYEDKADAITGNKLEVKDGVISSKHLQISTYLILKDLYDKYFSNMSKDRFMLGNKQSEFNKFLFMDSYYNDISDKLIVNSSIITDLIKGITFNSSDAFNMPERLERGMSVYEFMSEICQKCLMTFLALPQKFDVSSPGYMEDMFTPHLYKDLSDDEVNDGCYIGLYSYRPSQQLDIEGDMYAYKNDSFDIRDDNQNVLPSALRSLETNKEGKFKAIPAFGVTYAKQNQSLFKRINLTTSNQQVTEQSIFATMDVAAKGNEGPRESTLYGQDLYRVYSSYAYQCTVEMMGNIQIMPLMYFQLNNISMWHGAYMIISVEHNITAGDMTTKFTGVRVNRHAIPLVDADIILMDSNGNPIELSTGSTRTTSSYAGKGVTGENYTSPEIYDDKTNNFKPTKYRPPYTDVSGNTVDEEENEKLNATWAVRSRFTASPQIKGYCARWTYNLADSFVRGTRSSEPVKEGVSGGWGAKDPANHEAIRKLGYTLLFERHNINGQEILDIVRNKLKNSYKYGDVMFYWSDADDYGHKDTLEHHAQFYVGDAYQSTAEDYTPNIYNNGKILEHNGKSFSNTQGPLICKSGWATSTLNNYGTDFVYTSSANGEKDAYKGPHANNTWHILLYRCSRLMAEQKKDKENIGTFNSVTTSNWNMENAFPKQKPLTPQIPLKA